MIENRVEKSGLIQLDLSDYKKGLKVLSLDLKPFLFQEMILKEKDFREKVAAYDFSIFQDAQVAVFCSEDTIIPLWAYMVITSALKPFAQKVVLGDQKSVIQTAILDAVNNLDAAEYHNKRVIVKGCGEDVPAQAYVVLTEKLQPVVKSLMFGEACSTVPVYKG